MYNTLTSNEGAEVNFLDVLSAFSIVTKFHFVYHVFNLKKQSANFVIG